MAMMMGIIVRSNFWRCRIARAHNLFFRRGTSGEWGRVGIVLGGHGVVRHGGIRVHALQGLAIWYIIVWLALDIVSYYGLMMGRNGMVYHLEVTVGQPLVVLLIVNRSRRHRGGQEGIPLTVHATDGGESERTPKLPKQAGKKTANCNKHQDLSGLLENKRMEMGRD